MAAVTTEPRDSGVALNFVLPIGPTGSQGIQGAVGPQGVKGDTGPQGVSGETPQMAVVENTKTSYKFSFTTSGQQLTTPNLKSGSETQTCLQSAARCAFRWKPAP